MSDVGIGLLLALSLTCAVPAHAGSSSEFSFDFVGPGGPGSPGPTLDEVARWLRSPICPECVAPENRQFPSGKRVTREALCAEPAKHVCDFSFNPAAWLQKDLVTDHSQA